MKLKTDIKQEIQYFVYFLFVGTCDIRLIEAPYNYLNLLLTKPELLYDCFEIFAYDTQTNGEYRNQVLRERKKIIEGVEYHKTYENPLTIDYIIFLHENKESNAKKILAMAKKYNAKQTNFWIDFLVLSKWFCFNSFPNPVNENYLLGLNGCGTDGVPTFSVWTNVIEIDDNNNVLNSNFALKRANQRIKLWDNELPEQAFKDWELEQEIY